MLRFWEKQFPFSGKKHAPFLGKTCSVFGKHSVRFGEKQAPFLGNTVSVLVKNWLGVWIGLGQSSSLTSLGLDFRGLRLGVS